MARCSVVGVQVKDTWGLPSEGLVARSKGAGHRGLGHTGLGQRRPAGEPTCLTEKAPPCPWNGEPGFLPLSRWPWLNHLSFLDLGLLPAVWNDSHGAGLSRGWLVGRTVHREAPCVCGEPALHLATGDPALAHCPLWRAGRQPHTRMPPRPPSLQEDWRGQPHWDRRPRGRVSWECQPLSCRHGNFLLAPSG